MTDIALLVVDLMNPLDFDGSDGLVGDTYALADRARALKRRMRARELPIVYVNDDYERWHGNLPGLVDDLRQSGTPGRGLPERIGPGDGDYQLLKSKHSAFFATGLEPLLARLGVRRLVITGVQTHLCVLFTAADAYMRDFELSVPRDLVAAQRSEDHEMALTLMARELGADTTPSTKLALPGE